MLKHFNAAALQEICAHLTGDFLEDAPVGDVSFGQAQFPSPRKLFLHRPSGGISLPDMQLLLLKGTAVELEAWTHTSGGGMPQNGLVYVSAILYLRM